MHVRHIKSSTILVESGDVSVLCDPWILDGAFYGAWAHYPPVEFEPDDFDEIDYIYVSHIHPDHCHRETLERLDSDIPVLIHDYNWDFLRHNVEAAGFEVRELPHGERIHLGGDLHMNVLASDDCDPAVCGNHFACPWMAEDASSQGVDGSTQIDSMAVFDDGERTVLNLNDCRWPMSQRAAGRVKRQYGEIDLAMLQYTFAGGYPQGRIDYSHETLLEEREARRLQSLDNAVGFLELLEPDYYMPFAGSYTLAGDLAELNEYVARSTRAQARDYFESEERIDDGSECVLLNSGEWFDVAAGEQSSPTRRSIPRSAERTSRPNSRTESLRTSRIRCRPSRSSGSTSRRPTRTSTPSAAGSGSNRRRKSSSRWSTTTTCGLPRTGAATKSSTEYRREPTGDGSEWRWIPD